MKFEVVPRGLNGQACAIAIKKYGRLILNSASTRFLSDLGAKRVQFLWDPAAMCFAVRPATKVSAPNSYKLSFSVRGQPAVVAAKSFLRYIGYDLSQNRRHEALPNVKEKHLEVQLSKKDLIP